MLKIIDVSMPIYAGMPVYPGDPEVGVSPVADIAEGAPANVSALTLGTHTGTHVDPPFHLLRDGGRADKLPLDAMIGPALVLEASPETYGGEIDREILENPGLEGTVRVLFKTGGRAYLTEDAAKYLVKVGVRLVGTDCMSVDGDGADLRAHRALLESGVVIVEGLDLSAVKAGGYEMICLPLKIRDGDGSPARVVLLEDK